MEVIVNDKDPIELDLIEEMDVVAKEVYKVKQPIIYARTIIRAFLKAVGTNALSDELRKEDAVLGEMANILGKIGQEATEKADLRGWQTMPGKAYATVLNLAPGEHQVVLNYYGNGSLLHSDQKAITITQDDRLELVESLYWN